MPEGPEIRRAADRIADVLVGREVVEAYFAFPQLRRYVKQIKGNVVTAVDTRGKAMLTHFDKGLTLYSHNQLYGVWFTVPRDRPPQTGRRLRVALHTATHSALLYSASDIEVLTQAQLAIHPFLTRIGPDILDRDLSAADVATRLNEDRFRRRAVASLYLDQSFLAGVGNYLRSEILFAARIHPSIRPAELDRSARARLARVTLRISRRSYQTRGLTVTQKLARSLNGQGLSYQQYRFWVYRREGQPCHACGAAIRKTTLGSRGLFYCPTCQIQPNLKAD